MNVASDIPHNVYIITSENLETQNCVNQISDWTTRNKMKLNTQTTCAIIFKYTKNSQFTSRISDEGEVMEEVKQTKLLGVIVNDKLSWESNNQFLVTRANARMRQLYKLVSFIVPTEELVNT